jgi:hypothetical protein
LTHPLATQAELFGDVRELLGLADVDPVAADGDSAFGLREGARDPSRAAKAPAVSGASTPRCQRCPLGTFRKPRDRALPVSVLAEDHFRQEPRDLVGPRRACGAPERPLTGRSGAVPDRSPSEHPGTGLGGRGAGETVPLCSCFSIYNTPGGIGGWRTKSLQDRITPEHANPKPPKGKKGGNPLKIKELRPGNTDGRHWAANTGEKGERGRGSRAPVEPASILMYYALVDSSWARSRGQRRKRYCGSGGTT